MAIVGITHEKDGSARVTRTVTTKVAIGLPPRDGSDHPQRLDHFVFLKKQMNGQKIAWVEDKELTEHYSKQSADAGRGDKCREFWVTFLDDEPEQIFKTEYAAFVQRGRWCHGDGEKALRRNLGRDRDQWGDFEPFKGPCANNGCPLIENGTCAPSGDLYFMLADYPTLGTICRIHTSSYTSIRQIHSALLDLQKVTGGRLTGIHAKLFVAPDRNTYNGKTGIKWVLGLQLKAADLVQFADRMLETARTFALIKGQLGGRVLEIEEDEEERGPEIEAEFYPAAREDAPVVVDPDDPAARAQCDALLKQQGLNEAQRQMRLGQWQGKLPQLLEKLKGTSTTWPTANGSASPAGASPTSGSPASPQSPARGAANGKPADSATSPPRQERPATRGSANNAPPVSERTSTTAPPTPRAGPARPSSSPTATGKANDFPAAHGAQREAATGVVLHETGRGNLFGLDITDEDLPENMRAPQPRPQGGKHGFDF
jgi:hypothetical protein